MKLTPTLTLDMQGELDTGELCAFGTSPQGDMLGVAALKEPDTHVEQPGWARFFKPKPATGQDYRVALWSGHKCLRTLTIRNEPFNITHAMLVKEGLLLVCARCHYRSAEEIDQNGRVYAWDGQLVREVVFGDGIEDVLTTSGETVWCSYFDEGIFGNYGWSDPLGASGLVEWDLNGEKLYEYSPSGRLDHMADCYAATVDSAGFVWCCYYTDFPIVKLERDRVHAFWASPVYGAAAMAVSFPYVLFYGGYAHKDAVSLVHLRDGERAAVIGQWTLADADGRSIRIDRTASSAGALYLLSGKRVYRLDIDEVVNAG